MPDPNDEPPSRSPRHTEYVTPRPGVRFGRYLLREAIGAGAMGVVFRARDERLDRDVALKFLPPSLVADAPARARLELEARALSRLNHPHIATLFDAVLDEGVPFLVMELVEGEALDDRLRRQGPLGSAEVARIGLQLAEGLAVAHAHGVLHRDLKPANLRLTADGRLKILDFGVAKLAEPRADPLAETRLVEIDAATREPSPGATRVGAVVGTLPYLAPELLAGARPDARSDLYGAGAVLYELASGRRPFPEDESDRLAAAILRGSAPPIRSSAGPLPPVLEAAILRCLAREPDARFQSAHDLVEALAGVAPAPRSRPTLPVVDSIAVLPFSSEGASDGEYVAEGLTEGLIGALSEVPGLTRVIARSTVARLSQSARTPDEIGRALGVRAVLTGRVIETREHVLVSAELVEAADARRLWGERYERKRDAIRDLEHAIAAGVAGHLELKLPRRAHVQAARAVDPEAHRMYLRGRYFWNKRPGAGMVDKAIECFEEAVAIDPTYALAFAGLADCHNTLGSWEAGAVAPAIAAPRARRASAAALKLDSDLAEAHAARAYASLHFEWNPAAAGEGFRHALALNPNYAHAQHWYSHYLIAVGRHEEAHEASVRLLQLDPLDLIINVHLAWHHCMAREYEDAVRVSRATLDMEPHFHWGHFFMGWALQQLGRDGDAVDALRRADDLSGGSTVMRSALGYGYAAAGDTQAARSVLHGLLQLASARYVSSYEIGLIHAALGETDEAFVWLDRAVDERSGWIPYIGSEPRLDALRSDPRFAALVARTGFGR